MYALTIDLVMYQNSPTNCALIGLFIIYRRWSPKKTDIYEISDYKIGWSCSRNIETSIRIAGL
jgi:hypothetical protein